MKKIVILISSRGSNMEALLNAQLPCHIAAVISNKADAAGLTIARKLGFKTVVVPHSDYATRDLFDAALAIEIERHAPDLVVLAGFMRILSDGFVRQFQGRMVNIHPSLLPAFPGMHTHRRALEEGVRIHGCTVHFVTPSLDSGPIISQMAVPVYGDDSEDALSMRVLEQEHIAYPQAVRWFVEGRLTITQDGHVLVDREQRNPVALQVPPIDEMGSPSTGRVGVNIKMSVS